MDISASYNWLKEYVKTDLSPEKFAKEFSLRSMSVECIHDIHARCEHIVVGEVLTVSHHPDADRLHVVTVRIGKEDVTIVCGGTNLRVGMLVPVALPGARVCEAENDRCEIKLSTIRGVKSAGMLCGPAEVGFQSLQGEGRQIWDLTEITDAPVGTPLAEALGINDVVFDIEVTTNRPDVMGMIGLAREAAVAVDGEFLWTPIELPKAKETSLPLSVTIDDAERCKRQMAIVLQGVKIGQSPWWMQKRLALAGFRPINAVVDITNYVMLEYAQPLHAFDYSAIEGNVLHVRSGRKREQILALNEKTYDVTGHLVIADENKPLDIAGIMGGEHTGITKETTTLVFVASNFDAPSIRRTARALNITSEAQVLFEKGLSVEMPPLALARAVELTLEICGGEVASEVRDERVSLHEQKIFTIDPEKICRRIGVDIPEKTVTDMLERLGFELKKSGEMYSATVPYWRENDIENEVDFTEEVARMYGYHNMPAVLPASRLPEGNDDSSLIWEDWLKHALAERGYTECFSNSLISVSDLETYGISPKDAMSVLNPLSEDLTHLRTTLVPSMLRAIERNQALTPSAKIFEISRVYLPREGDLPDERLSLLAGMYGVNDPESAFMELRSLLDWIAVRTGVSPIFERIEGDHHWHTGRSVSIHCDGVRVGVLGQIAPEFQIAFGVNRPAFFIRIDVESLLPSMSLRYAYRPVPVFPAVHRDIAVLLDERAEFKKVHDVICGSGALITACDVVDIYRGEEIPEGKKSMTLSLTMMAPDRTLTSEEVDDLLTTVTRELALRVDGIVRG